MTVSAEARLKLGNWLVSQDWVSQYLAAVGDGQDTYFQTGMAPPVALSAWALGSLLQNPSLPPGAIHSLQELETHRGLRMGEEITATAYLSKARRRGNMEFRTVGYTLSDQAGTAVQCGKSTVLVIDSDSSVAEGEMPPAAGRTRRSGNAQAGPVQSKDDDDNHPGRLSPLSKIIGQGQLNAYAQASGDHNPLHLDAAFAAGTQFGGIIAHGMLTLAFIGEMMAAAFGQVWLETGCLAARFKGAAYLGDRLQAWGRVTKEEPHSQGRLVECSVGVKNLLGGQDLVSGTASVKG